MTDICKCQNAECMLASKCYRRVAKPHPLYQSYGMFHVDWQTGQCDYYIPALKLVRKRPGINDGNHAEKCSSILPKLPEIDCGSSSEEV